ncbi:ECF transporter S component [Carnobacterium divergens]|uniref:ECF transporter S component n=1 Tax=Carnobacterium divergens TaxID=2748 RepID=UPI00107220FD|nr:ECF transporter S component [Carnobacterium divergens]MDT1997408.1 ECF transporter S component [Carnobacterium divergens]TFI64221.1 ECF transporter S component [Carnobacterium divergens]TFI64464.1 ECF transporter S component [Carnobacterium divergens]TFI67355.1 ECF transporter S component [Carnobacterium divergens]TFI79628.1 ECF transporter S component [Carnobacterium divergens]
MFNQSKKTYQIAILGMLTAIVLIQNFVPVVGYIPIPPINPTIIHITVIIAALTLGYKNGMILGLVWGVACIIRAFTTPTSPLDILFFTNPIIAIIPRILVGFVAGYVYQLLKKTKLLDSISMIISAVLASLTNTIFVLLFIYLFYRVEYASFLNVDQGKLIGIMGIVIVTSGVAEAVAAGIISPIVAKALKQFVPTKN